MSERRGRRTPAGDALTELVLPVFELNGEFLAAAKDIAEPAGLTPAWWQVLGATLDEALPVAEIARRVGLGLARQSVQRTADVLVEKGWAVYRDNPQHRRAKLLEPTSQGRETLNGLTAAQHAWADAVGEVVDAEELRAALATIRTVIDASRAVRSGPREGTGADTRGPKAGRRPTRHSIWCIDEDSVAELLDQAIERWSVPGAQIGLRRGGDRLVACSGVVGVHDPTPVGPETSFHAGSLTKSLVGLVVLDAARRGDIDLDSSCVEQGGEGLWAETPRAILSQTTGRPNDLPEAGESLEDFASRTGALPLVHQPGRFSYCNAGWPVLDLLMRRVTGRSFEEAAHDLLGPLQFGVPDGAAHGHQVVPDQAPVRVSHDDSGVASAAGSRWFCTADGLLDYAELYLGHPPATINPADLAAVHTATAELPGHTVFDAWGLGFGLWDRGRHQAFGWAGYTTGHRSYLRCFPDQDAAVVVLTNCAGPLLGPPGGAALFDDVLPRVIEALGVPVLGDPTHSSATPAPQLAGQYGPLVLSADADELFLDARALGVLAPIACHRLGGDTFTTSALGGMPFSVDAGLLYLGPFAMPKVG